MKKAYVKKGGILTRLFRVHKLCIGFVESLLREFKAIGHGGHDSRNLRMEVKA